jgi:Zn finger protein HypA/HybF involved in hydrogenase expression
MNIVRETYARERNELCAPCPACGELALSMTAGNAAYLDSLDVET